MSREDANKTKGSNFKPADDLALATCWVAISQKTTEQNSDTFWNSVMNEYEKQPRTLTPRSAASLKCRWTTVQKVTQKYLAAEKLYRANVPSGETEEDTTTNIMKLYRERCATTEKDGSKKLAAPVKFLDAVKLLSTHPKFSATVGGGSSSSAPAYRWRASSGG